MAKEYDFLMQKTADNSVVKSSLADFGFAVSNIPWPDEEIVPLAVRTWEGEAGEDPYLPPTGLKLKAYDLIVEFCYKGDIDTAVDAYKTLRRYLLGIDGDGAELRVYDPYWKRGRTKVHIEKIGDFDPNRSNIDEGLSMKVVFRVADPTAECELEHESIPHNKIRLEGSSGGYITLES